MSEPLKENEIRVLAVNPEWASLIIQGIKKIEVRPRPTNIRERVAIYATTPVNKILGTVEIVGCVKLRIKFEYDLYADEHFAPDNYYKEGSTYFWDLRRPIEFAVPIPYKPPKGAIVWSKTVLPEGY